MDMIQRAGTALIERFRTGHVVLFCGRATRNEDLQILASQNFSFVLTSRSDNDFSHYFHNSKRVIFDRESLNELPPNPLNKDRELTILRLQPTVFIPDENSFDSPAEQRREHVTKMLGVLKRLVKGANTLVITGLAPGAEGEVELRALNNILKELVVYKGGIQFWDVDASAPGMDRMKTIAENLGYSWCAAPLADVFQMDQDASGDTQDETFYLYDEANEHFFKDGKAYPISKEELPSGIYTLLTQEAIYSNQPVGSEAVKHRFLQFLENSSVEGPQWYGYLEGSEYHVRRSFEDPLEEYVLKLLNGTAKHPGPVILHGDPCTSKSVALGNLAYRIFSRHTSPVIFISRDAALFSPNTPEFEELLELMRYVGAAGSTNADQQDSADKNARTLLIWDCSTYADVEKSALELANNLTNRGRRFALVCSAYRTPDRAPTGKMEFSNSVNWICADRSLSKDEQNRLLGKIGEYLDDDEVGASVYRTMEQTSDIFEIFYTMVNKLRKPLEQSLEREESEIESQIRQEQLLSGVSEAAQAEETATMAAYRAAMAKKGLSLPEMSHGAAGQSQKKLPYDLTRFIDSVALLSRFRMKLPLELGLKLLKADGVKDDAFNRVMYSGTLFNAITKKIPWIHYGLDANGTDYMFSYRNTREAELRMKRKDLTGKQQVELLCQILDKGYWDITSDYNLDDLLRFMGPNSNYFKDNAALETEHRDILRNLGTVIDKLEQMYQANLLDDECADMVSILVTMTREYYGTDWSRNFNAEENGAAFDEEHYHRRLKKLSWAKQVAKKHFQALESDILNGSSNYRLGHKNTMCNTLAVEIATLDYHIREVLNEYHERFPNTSKQFEKSLVKPEPYHTTFLRLSRIVKSDPDNGYPYNALFSEFINMYENSNLSREDKLRYLTQIQIIADECDVEAIRQSRTDKTNILIDRLAKISSYAGKYEVSIDQIESGNMDPDFAKLYNSLLRSGNSSGITFVCQRELEKAGLRRKYKLQKNKDRSTNDNFDKPLTKAQKKVCQKVISFMRRDQNYACVARDYYATNLLLRTTWMKYTGTELNGTRECQPICMSVDEWSSIKELGELCLFLAGKEGGNIAPPVVTLITALAKLQIAGDDAGVQKALDTIDLRRFRTVRRMRVPFLVCHRDTGKPVLCSGKLQASARNARNYSLRPDEMADYSIHSEIRFIEDGFSRYSGKHQSGRRELNLYLGLGYTGFAAFTQKWLDTREER